MHRKVGKYNFKNVKLALLYFTIKWYIYSIAEKLKKV